MAVAELLVRHGAASPRDWDTATGSAPELIENAIERHVDHLNRGIADGWSVSAFVRPWSQFLAGMELDPAPDERRWALGLEAFDSFRLEVSPLVESIGTLGTAVVLHALETYSPVFVATPSELDWIIDGWRDNGHEETTEEARLISERADAAAVLSQRIDDLVRHGSHTPRSAIGDRRLRRFVDALAALHLTTPAQPRDGESPWEETSDVDWNLPLPVIQYVWSDECALNHAADEADFVAMQEGGFTQPQQLWLFDPYDEDGAWIVWRRWLHALRLLRAMSRILAALRTLTRTRPPA